MERRACGWWLAGAVALAVAVGCEPAKELPTEVPKQAPPADVWAAPTESDPTAKAHVEKVVKAFTAGKPDLLAKVKYSRAALKGTMVISGENPAVRAITGVWPDRYAVANDLQIADQKLLVRAWSNRTRFTAMNGDREQENINRSETASVFVADGTGQHWMALLQPLTDPKAVVYDLQSVTGTSPQTGLLHPVTLVKLALPDRPLFQLTFDSKTDTLLRVEYMIRESGVDRRKQWTALEHKPGPDGLILPTKTEVRHDGQLVERWTVEKWEFPATIPDTEFDPPTPKQ